MEFFPTGDDLYGVLSSTVYDSFVPSMEPTPEMTPQEMEIFLDDVLSPNVSFAPSMEPNPEMIPQQMEISSLPEEVDNINSGVVPSAVHGVEVQQLDKDNKVHEKVKSKGKYEVWTEMEHRLFLEGLKKYEKGKTSKKWKKISAEFVGSKTPREVASHAQNFNKSQKNKEGKRLRWSINDIARPV